MYDEWLLELWLREQDPRYINWKRAFERWGWTEDLLREYSDYIDWDIANKVIGGRIFSLDFAREMREKFSVGEGEVFTYKGIVII